MPRRGTTLTLAASGSKWPDGTKSDCYMQVRDFGFSGYSYWGNKDLSSQQRRTWVLGQFKRSVGINPKHCSTDKALLLSSAQYSFRSMSATVADPAIGHGEFVQTAQAIEEMLQNSIRFGAIFREGDSESPCADSIEFVR